MSRPGIRLFGCDPKVMALAGAGLVAGCANNPVARGFQSPGGVVIADVSLAPGQLVSNPTALCQEVTHSAAFQGVGGPFIKQDGQTYQRCVSNPPPENALGYGEGYGYGGALTNSFHGTIGSYKTNKHGGSFSTFSY